MGTRAHEVLGVESVGVARFGWRRETCVRVQYPMPNLKPEQLAREAIDRQLSKSGWVVQDLDEIQLSAARGVAVWEFPLVAPGRVVSFHEDSCLAMDLRTSSLHGSQARFYSHHPNGWCWYDSRTTCQIVI